MPGLSDLLAYILGPDQAGSPPVPGTNDTGVPDTSAPAQVAPATPLRSAMFGGSGGQPVRVASADDGSPSPAPAPAAPAPQQATPVNYMRDALIGWTRPPPPVVARDAVRSSIPSIPVPPMPVRGNTFRDAIGDIAAGMSGDISGLSKGAAFAKGLTGYLGASTARERQQIEQENQDKQRMYQNLLRAAEEDRSRSGERRSQQSHDVNQWARTGQELRQQTQAGWQNVSNMMGLYSKFSQDNPGMSTADLARVNQTLTAMYGHVAKLSETDPAAAKRDWDKYLGYLKQNFPGMKFDSFENSAPVGPSGNKPAPAPPPTAPASPPAANTPMVQGGGGVVGSAVAAPAPSAAPPPPPPIGTVEGGFRLKAYPAGDPNNWEKVAD